MRFAFSLPDSVGHERKQWPQVLAVLAASLSSMTIGMHFAWTSPALPIIQSDDFPVNVTSGEASNIAAIGPFGNVLAAPLAGYLADSVGRKTTLLLIALPTFVSWMVYAFAGSTAEFYLGRFLAGIGDGLYFTCYPMYVGEITEPHIRGILCGHITMLVDFGMLLMICYGPYVSIRDGAFISAVLPVLLVVCFVWMPESPYYLVMKSKRTEAKRSLRFLRRSDIEYDFEVLQHDVQRQLSETGTYRDLLTIPSNRRALFIVGGARSIQQFSGVSAWTLFAQSIFQQADTNLAPSTSACIFFAVLLVAASWGSILSDRFGRRPTLFYSCLTTGLVLNTGGVYFLFDEVLGNGTNSIRWFPLLVLILFAVTYSAGMGVIPPLMLAELFSASVKGKALCVMCVFYSLLTSVTSKLFYLLNEQFGLFANFFFFGEMCFLGCLFTYYVLPETKGKSLEEIQQYLMRNNNKVGIEQRKTCSL